MARNAQTAAATARKHDTSKVMSLMSASNTSTTALEFDYMGPRPGQDGFDINVTTNTTTAAITVYCVAIRGGAWDVGTFQAKTDTTGTQEVPTAFTPKGAMLLSTFTNADDTISPNARLALGCGTATTAGQQQSVWYGDTNTAMPTVVSRSSSTTQIHRNLTEAATSANSVLNAECTLSALGATYFTPNWGTVVPVAQAYRISVLYFGDLDPSGKYMIQDIINKFNHYNYLHSGGGNPRRYPLQDPLECEIVDVAVKPEHVEAYGLPSDPDEDTAKRLKKNDSRYKWFLGKYGKLYAIELDALAGKNPLEFRDLVIDAVEGYYDYGIWQKAQRAHSEKKVKRALRKKVIKELVPLLEGLRKKQ
jgi:hypothetical protein